MALRIFTPSETGWEGNLQKKIEKFFPKPLPNQGPMRKGQPQEPAGNWPKGGVGAEVGRGIQQGVQEGLKPITAPLQKVQDAIFKLLSKETAMDVAAYTGAVLLLIIVVIAALRR